MGLCKSDSTRFISLTSAFAPDRASLRRCAWRLTAAAAWR